MRKLTRVLSVSVLLACAGTALSQQVKISQVYGGGGNAGAPFNRDFVELFNAGGAAVDISGWSIQYASATGTTWSKTDLTGVVLQPGQYYLAQMTLTGTTGAGLPTPDHVVLTSIAMSATVGKVALVNNTTALTGACPSGSQIIDFVGFGTTANCNEGGANTAAPANATAVLRGSAGCTDTNNNGADFTVDVPNPRNTSSALNPCPLPPGADLGISLTDNVSQINAGATTVYSITVNNFGPDTSPEASVVFTIPANASFVGSNPPVVPVGNTVTFATGSIALAGSTNMTVTLQATSGTSLAASATVTGTLTDSAASNNTAVDSTLIYDQARARVIAGTQTGAQPILAFDTGSGASEVLATDDVRAMAADDADRVLYYSKGTELWKLPYDAPRIPELVGSFNGAVTTISGGMAFDPVRRKLIASTTSSFYEVSTSTARVTLLRAVGAGDFGGIDYDAVNDRVVAMNDSTSTTNGLAGRGLYRVDVYSAEVPTFVGMYPIKTAPATLDTDIDGLAYGGGFWYPVADETNWLYTFDENSATFPAQVTTGFGADRTASGAAYTAQLFNRPPGANLSAKVTAGAADCTVTQGGNLSYTVSVKNLGPDVATSTSLISTLPAGTSFVSSNPPVVPVGNTVTLAAGNLGDGQSATLEITVATSAAGILTLSGSANTTAADPLPLNNTASTDTRVAALPPATAEAKGVFSTMPGSNAVPGIPTVVFSDVVDMGRIYRSASGNFWLMHADTDVLDATQDRVLLRGTSSSFEVVAQEGVTPLPSGFPSTATFDAVVGINDNGDFIFSTDEDTATTAGKQVVRSVGGVLSNVALQNSPVSPVVGASFGGTMSAAFILNDGTGACSSNMTGVATTEDTGLFSGNGSTIVAQEGITSPAGQLGAQLWQGFLNANDRSFSGSADGLHYLASGDLDGDATTDAITVVDGSVVIQEGTILPNSSFISNVTTILMSYMNPDGTWFAYGSNSDGTDWAVRNGQVVATRGDEIFPGAGIHWAEAGFTQTFFMNVGNGSGDVVVGGLTDAPDTNANAMLVLNGERIVLRENDPIDLNNNGTFDDDAYVHIFRDDFAFLNDAGDLYVPVRIRNGAGLCGGTPTEVGQALVRITLDLGGCPQDFNNDGDVNPDDLGDYINCFFAVPPCDQADFNNDGDVNPDDLGDFINAFFGPPCA